MRDKALLTQLQALPLDAKVLMTQRRIREWYNHFGGDVCISFSGGKDSTVLAHLVHSIYPDVPLVFANTGLEYPEIQAFAKKMGAEFVRPKMRFDEVITKYGYPLISKEVAEAIHCARYIVQKDYESLDPEHREEESHTWTGRKRQEMNGVQRMYKAANDSGPQTSSTPPKKIKTTQTQLRITDQMQNNSPCSTCKRSQRKAATISTTGKTGGEKLSSG